MAEEPLSLQEISDRIRIQDLLVRYTAAIDRKDWKLLDTVFTPDATVDYTTSGGIRGSYPEVRAWLQKALAAFPMTQHLIGNSELELHGDEARCRTMVFNPMGGQKPEGGLQIFYVGAYYVDRLVRTAEGWRIAERFEEQAFFDGALPEGHRIPES
ncbi:MAG: nuclear transport factor 2 family protein [Myxococcota bacterium]